MITFITITGIAILLTSIVLTIRGNRKIRQKHINDHLKRRQERRGHLSQIYNQSQPHIMDDDDHLYNPRYPVKTVFVPDNDVNRSEGYEYTFSSPTDDSPSNNMPSEDTYTGFGGGDFGGGGASESYGDSGSSSYDSGSSDSSSSYDSGSSDSGSSYSD